MSKMIGRITMHSTQNYGALLQTYALQYVLAKRGYKSEVIDYWLDPMNSMLNGYNWKNRIGLKSKIRYLLSSVITLGWHPKETEERAVKSVNFLKEFIPLSPKSYLSYESLKSTNYDVYICGSDQIWTPGMRRAFSLDFVGEDKIKIAYGASFGVHRIPNEKVHKFKEMMRRFDAISVREREGEKIVFDILNKHVDVVLDPTLLMNGNDWNSIPSTEIPKKKYILCYFLGDLKKLVSFAKEIGSNLQAKLIILIDVEKIRNSISFHKLTSIKRYYENISVITDNKEFFCLSAGPLEFINLIKNAEYIVTDSFHGMAMSISLHKNFCAITNTGFGRSNMSARLFDLAALLNVQGKVFKNIPLIENINFDIDWDEVEEKLQNMRLKSLEFLDTNLEKP